MAIAPMSFPMLTFEQANPMLAAQSYTTQQALQRALASQQQTAANYAPQMAQANLQDILSRAQLAQQQAGLAGQQAQWFGSSAQSQIGLQGGQAANQYAQANQMNAQTPGLTQQTNAKAVQDTIEAAKNQAIYQNLVAPSIGGADDPFRQVKQDMAAGNYTLPTNNIPRLSGAINSVSPGSAQIPSQQQGGQQFPTGNVQSLRDPTAPLSAQGGIGQQTGYTPQIQQQIQQGNQQQGNSQQALSQKIQDLMNGSPTPESMAVIKSLTGSPYSLQQKAQIAIQQAGGKQAEISRAESLQKMMDGFSAAGTAAQDALNNNDAWKDAYDASWAKGALLGRPAVAQFDSNAMTAIKSANGLVLGQLKPMFAGTGGRVLQMEMNKLEGALPSQTLPKEAADNIYAEVKSVLLGAQYKQQLAQSLKQYTNDPNVIQNVMTLAMKNSNPYYRIDPQNIAKSIDNSKYNEWSSYANPQTVTAAAQGQQVLPQNVATRKAQEINLDLAYSAQKQGMTVEQYKQRPEVQQWLTNQ